MSKHLDDMLYRMGIGDKQKYWDGKIEEHAQAAMSPEAEAQRQRLHEAATNPGVVADGVRGSVQDVLKEHMTRIMASILASMPREFKSVSAQVESPPGLVVTARAEGKQLGVVPTTTRIRLEMDPGTLREIVALVDFEDSTYDPRDFKNDSETFMIDWTSPAEDLVGLIVRYLNSRSRTAGL